MILKLPTNRLEIDGIFLAHLLPTNESDSTITTGSVQQQLTPLFYDMLMKTTKATTTIIDEITNSKQNASTTNTTNSGDNANLINTSNGSRGLRSSIIALSHMLNIGSSENNSNATIISSFTTFPSYASSVHATLSTTQSSSSLSSSIISATTDIITIADNSNSTSAVSISHILDMGWPKALIVATFLLLILVTIVGNTLVILAVVTTRRLRTVTNCFVMNLAITDWLVGTCVMPPAVLVYALGNWRFGWILCDIWISLDVLLCTGSILSLCAISLDRYLAVTQPLTYSKKRRSKRLALIMIFVVWVTALSITCPPYLGWYEKGRRADGFVVCRYNQNKGYVVFSAMGSFFIPLAVMMYVYLKIGYVLTSRRQRIVRDANIERTADNEIDCDNFISESEHFQCATPKFPTFKTRWTFNGSKKNSIQCESCEKFNTIHIERMGLRHEESFYELVDVSRLSSLIHCSMLSCKYDGPCMHHNMPPFGKPKPNGTESNGGGKSAQTLPELSNTMHFSDSHASFKETCLTTTASTMTSTTLHNVKFNVDHLLHDQNGQPHQQQQQQQRQQNKQHQHNHHHRVPMRISTTKRDTKTAKTLSMVMGGFVICWLPFFVYYLLIPFLPPKAVIEGLQTFLTWVGWVNCAINPFIYAFYNPDFRIAFWRLTCRRICKQKQQSKHLAMFRG